MSEDTQSQDTTEATTPAPGDIVAAPARRERVSAVIGRVNRPAASQQRSRGRRTERAKPDADDADALFEKVVHINRCAKVVAGGRRFSFAALVVVGDRNGRVGVGYGKAKEVPECIRKGTERAKRGMLAVQLKNNTIPHEAIGDHDGGRIMLRPAVPGTGIIAGGGVRAVLEASGIKDVLTKSLGSNNPGAVVFATIAALRQMRTAEHIRRIRQS
jgi:small subunit ribosomal protein S5